MPIDENVSVLDKMIDKISQDDRNRRINQRIIPKYVEEAIENLIRSRVVRSRFKALLLLAEPAARDINDAVNNQVSSIVRTRVNTTESQAETAGAPKKRGRKKIAR